MPGFITHLTFGEQSLSFIDSKETISLLETHKTAFALGLQGPDLFFYHIPSYICYKHNIGNIIHRNRVMHFFNSLFDVRNSFDDNKARRICDAYILGFIGHYSLDVTCHPYIYFKSEHLKNLVRGNLYDFGKHVSLETDIDHLVLEHYRQLKPSQFDYAAAVCPPEDEQLVIARILYLAIDRTFPEHKIRFSSAKGAIKSFIRLNRWMHDPSGKKKRRIRKIEQLFFKYAAISSMIPSDTIIKYSDPCNTFHNTWHNPWNPSIPMTDSIYDLINKTMPTFIERIELYMKSSDSSAFLDSNMDSISETNQYLHYRNKLLQHLSDLSYLSGLPLE